MFKIVVTDSGHGSYRYRIGPDVGPPDAEGTVATPHMLGIAVERYFAARPGPEKRCMCGKCE